jgi:hypothetical protein
MDPVFAVPGDGCAPGRNGALWRIKAMARQQDKEVENANPRTERLLSRH